MGKIPQIFLKLKLLKSRDQNDSEHVITCRYVSIITLQYSDNSQNSLSSHGLDEEGSRPVCLSDHILRSEQSIYRPV